MFVLIVAKICRSVSVIVCVCTVHCNIILQYQPTKCTFLKLIFQFLILVSSTCFEPEGRRLYMQLWYGICFSCIGASTLVGMSIERTLQPTRLLKLMRVKHTTP